ncbi:MAG: PRC-barrel domain-containing protein [Candidatus Kerfeldbacteria bacterium]|nr:PRC-barrel domain-containing protein [Candidatus Kerfeldbacteria bacterium]
MRISTDKLIGLPVETESGTKLGKVHAVVLDIDFSSVVHYVVRPLGIVEELIYRHERLVAPAQVRSITEKKMVVDDALIKEKESAKMKSVLRPRSVVS